ncbi:MULTISPECIES: ProQ/FINO family protein [unclassified Variovorax]|uniref:ProQ/FINO family protein n=1 Tax=unclassified Variovorax TaxID=663243 RepID=UPI00076C3BF8|nr:MULTISPECIES: ProQ/FINO family protein [unclassified Variovorax]KWT75995.1 ProQ: influences osmotic activation of compatible solute ProP [Variovorax sp. WDL1]PNG51586.1 RNA chaperone ProQ [Variovorax sp. B2]PNG54388.1 RNA chaperone ProQ [Variovorax sp. B4]VTV11887.1 ProP effector [Variovorax sp. WDL1]
MTSNTSDTATAPSPQPSQPKNEPNAPAGRKKHRRAGAAQQRAQAQQPPQGKQPAHPRKTHPVLERLFELYPGLFGARFLPLKLGVFEDLLAAHADEFKREDLKVALGLHARSTRYLEAVASGKQRHDLSGVPVEPVAPEHVHHAILEVFRRRKARSGEDLRAQLRTRLMAAIEASGLSREDYMLVVRSNDETANAVLDEAFAELGARNAKREALRRAFEASGRSLAEFAEMYGMDPGEVKRTLAAGRARTEPSDPT